MDEVDLPKSARWVRTALQVNPYAYAGASGPATFFDDEDTYNSALLESCATEGIELIAITDHWCIDSAGNLASAAREKGIAVLPGFEANTSEGIHLLVIFAAETSFTDINAAIGQCGRNITPGCLSGTAGDSYEDVMRNMAARNALVIPAHANVGPRGMLAVLRGMPLAKMIQHEDLHAIAISPSQPEAADQQSVFAGKTPFDRPHKLAMLYADDISHPNRLGNTGGTTWVKMSEIGLPGLKHAVRTPETRISLVDPTRRATTQFSSLSWTGGYLDGVTVPFANDLTAFIGGRGTGKSTAIESLRYVLGIRPLGENAERDHSAVIADVVERGTIVELSVDAVSPIAGRYTIRRTVPDPPIVLDASGFATELKPEDITGHVEIFGQHELAEVAEHPQHVAKLIARFSQEKLEVNVDEIRGKLADNRARLSELEGKQAKLEEELADVPRLEATVRQFAQADWPSRLTEQSRATQDEAMINEARGRLDLASAAVEELVQHDVVQSLREQYEAIDDSPESTLLLEARKVTDDLSHTVEGALAAITSAIDAAGSKLDNIRERLTVRLAPKRAAHAEVVRTLKAEGHDPDRLIATQERLAHLVSRAPQRETLQRRHSSLAAERRTLLDELEAAETAVRKHLGRSITAANAATKGIVMAKPIASPDRDHLISIVDQHISNSRKALLDIVRDDNFSPRQFVMLAREGNLKDSYALSASQMSAIVAAGDPFLRELEEASVERAVQVSLNVADGDSPAAYKALETLSKGQRATALLLLLLSVSKSPLVIDQPEDDLDNRFIYFGVVRHLRELKGKRQVIVSTHNANVPVLGDAELVITLEGDGQRGRVNPEKSGSLDSPQVMRAAEDILEGGHLAFDTRRHLYGF